MPSATKTIVGYLYRDEHYCPGCILRVVDPGLLSEWDTETYLNLLSSFARMDRSRPASFSQRDFPHTIISGQLDEPVRCDTCMEEIR